MQRLRRPRGLIRLTSHEAIRAGRSSWLTTRVKAYAAVWALLVCAVTVLLVARRDLDVLILRQPGTLYAAFDGQTVANFYNVQVINRTNRPHSLDYRVVAPAGATITPLGPISLTAPHGMLESRLFVSVPRASLAGAATPVRFEIRADGRVINTIDSSFLGPAIGGH
jgi:polyferredoxin